MIAGYLGLCLLSGAYAVRRSLISSTPVQALMSATLGFLFLCITPLTMIFIFAILIGQNGRIETGFNTACWSIPPLAAFRWEDLQDASVRWSLLWGCLGLLALYGLTALIYWHTVQNFYRYNDRVERKLESVAGKASQ